MGVLQRQIAGFYGKKAFQAFFERLFFIALRGMNYGNGSDYEKSGEKYIFGLINRIFSDKEIVAYHESFEICLTTNLSNFKVS